MPLVGGWEGLWIQNQGSVPGVLSLLKRGDWSAPLFSAVCVHCICCGAYLVCISGLLLVFCWVSDVNCFTERPGRALEPVQWRDWICKFSESEREEEKVSIKKKGQAIRSVQLLVGQQPGTAVRLEG